MISIIVPVYKVELYLERCIESIRKQTFSDFDLILIDDGSPDRCGEICDNYARLDKRIHVIHQDNQGLSAARNAGIDWAFHNSNSQWLTFIDSDDWIHPQYLEILYDAVTKYNMNVVSCELYRTKEEILDYPLITEIFPTWLEPEEFYLQTGILACVACGKLYRKDLFKEIRYPIGRIHEDEFTTYKILFDVDKIGLIQLPLYYYYDNPDGIMNHTFSIKKYDRIVAYEERIVFFLERGFVELVEKVKNDIQFDIANNSLAARKAKVYKQVPEKYRISIFKAIKTMKKILNKNQYEWIMSQYYPNLIKFLAILRRINVFILKK